jgi:hypothetical protein
MLSGDVCKKPGRVPADLVLTITAGREDERSRI